MNEHQRWFWRQDAYDKFCNIPGIRTFGDAEYDAMARQLGDIGMARFEFNNAIRHQATLDSCPTWMREMFEETRRKIAAGELE